MDIEQTQQRILNLEKDVEFIKSHIKNNTLEFKQGIFYNGEIFDAKKLEGEIAKLILDDITNKKGIYPYVLTREEKYLSIRSFSDAIKQKIYEKQKGICKICGKHFKLSEMEADHITPWCEGGKTIEENCQMLCKECNRRKSRK